MNLWNVLHKYTLYGLIIVFAPFIFQKNALSAPSFSCKAPSAIEKIICDSEDLSAKDRLLAHFFGIAKAGALGIFESNVVEVQRKWVADRNKACAKSLGSQCIASAYDDRLFNLAVSVLFSDHDTAIK